MTTPKELREFWVYRDLLTGAVHFSTAPINDSTIYEYMNHLIELSAYEQLREECERLKAELANRPYQQVIPTKFPGGI